MWCCVAMVTLLSYLLDFRQPLLLDSFAVVMLQVKNLALGLAARGVDWSVQGWGGSMLIATRLLGRLFANLMHR